MFGSEFGPDIAQLTAAYRAVTAELVGDAALRQRCAAVEALVVRRLNDLRSAGKTLLLALNGCAGWDWPAWDGFAREQGYDTLAAVERRYARMKLADVLAKASKDELVQALEGLGIGFKRSQTKAALGALVETAGQAKALGALGGVVQRLRDKDVRDCRETMALFVVTRIHLLAEHAMRRQQLDEAGEGRWRFVCESPNGERCRSGQRHLRGKVLPASEGRLAFPHLPCTWLSCPGRIVFER